MRSPPLVREYRLAEFEQLCRACFARVELLGVFHARRLRIHDGALRMGWDAVHARLGLTELFYDRFTPAIATSDFAIRATARGRLDRALDFLAVCRP